MITSLSRNARQALLWGRKRLAVLLRRRRTQLLAAVLFGAIVGGGFVAVATTGLDGSDHRGHAGVSVMGRPDRGPMGNSGYDGNDR